MKHFSLIGEHFATNSKLFLKAPGKLIQYIYERPLLYATIHGGKGS